MSTAKANKGVLLGKSNLYYKDRVDPVVKEGDSMII